ncbi:MAG: hypothetical protein FWH08_03480 [Oscillospiraceae bacterium]|nr:hypothetical protein [Oscillospiraceae bacterium]
MDYNAAVEILDFLEKYDNHFRELRSFINEKQEKAWGDDLEWLLNSLTEEQKFIMRGNSLEAKRLLLFEKLGVKDYDSKRLVEECPPEIKGRMNLVINSIDDSISYIRETNKNVLELARRKLETQAELLDDSLIAGSDTYNNSGSKIKKIGGDDDNIIGSV